MQPAHLSLHKGMPLIGGMGRNSAGRILHSLLGKSGGATCALGIYTLSLWMPLAREGRPN